MPGSDSCGSTWHHRLAQHHGQQGKANRELACSLEYHRADRVCDKSLLPDEDRHALGQLPPEDSLSIVVSGSDPNLDLRLSRWRTSLQTWGGSGPAARFTCGRGREGEAAINYES